MVKWLRVSSGPASIHRKNTEEGASVTGCREEWPRRTFTAQEMDGLELDIAEEEKGMEAANKAGPSRALAHDTNLHQAMTDADVIRPCYRVF